MRRLCAILILTTLTACVSGGKTAATDAGPRSIEGTYRYFASVPSGHVRGTLIVLPDTMLVEPEDDECWPLKVNNMRYMGLSAIPYGCRKAIIAFDRQKPAQGSRWIQYFTVRKTREVCAQYAVQNGRDVCIRRQSEPYEATESRSGRLQVERSSLPP